MSRKAKIILGISLGFVGLLIILIVGGVVFSLFMGGTQNKESADALFSSVSAPPSASGLSKSGRSSDSELADNAMPPSAAPAESGSAGDAVNLTEKKIIKTANLEITVASVDSAVADLTSIASRSQGFVQSSYVYESETGMKSGTVVIKVPAAKFDAILNEVKDLARVVTREQVSGQDVTEEYVDLQAQLKNAQAAEQQYLEIMKKATEVEDILKVASALSIVREKIERLQGQLQYLVNMTDMSTLTLELSEETRVASGVEKWKPYETLKQSFKTLIGVGQKTIDRLIWILVFLVGFFLPIGIIVWIIVKIVKKARRKGRENRDIQAPRV